MLPPRPAVVQPRINEQRRRDKLTPIAERWAERAKLLRGPDPRMSHGECGCDDCKVWKRGGYKLGSRALAETHELSCRCDGCKLRRHAGYAASRADALGRRVGPRLEQCGLDAIPIACSCQARVAYERCRQFWLCRACQKARQTRLEIRIRTSLDHALGVERDRWAARGGFGVKPGLTLLTLTQRHSDDIAADMNALRGGWRKMYKSMHEEGRRRNKRRLWGKFSYVWVWEVTPGRCRKCDGYVDDLASRGAKRSRHSDGERATADEHKERTPCACNHPDPEGHVHMHVACVWGYRDWNKVRELWLKACPTSEVISIVRARDDGKSSTAGSISRYLGKYLSKGVDHDAFTEDLRADVSAAFYNTHAVGTSAHFWLPESHNCRKCNTAIKRVIAVEPWLYDTIKDSAPENLYYLVRQTPLEEQLPELVAHIWGGGLERSYA